jgi:outer membrane phospholipase A
MSKKHAVVFLALLLTVLSFTGALNAYVNEFDAPHWNIEGYRSNYFMFGNPSSKLNMSFKIKLIQNTTFYFAYTQLMMWDLWADSQPMRDLNYNPEVFYRYIFSDENKLWLDLGLEHESNGLDGDRSRGWNRIYARYSSSSGVMMDHVFFWSMKAWFPYGYDSTSIDIAKYRGIGEFEFTIKDLLKGFFDRNDLTFRVYPGGPAFVDPLRGGQEITFRFNRDFMANFLPIWIIQFFHGYGENLLDDKKEHFDFRVGLGF